MWSMKRGGIWVERKETRPELFLVWHHVAGEGDELIGLFEHEHEMEEAYQEALKHFEAETLHWTKVPMGWSCFE